MKNIFSRAVFCEIPDWNAETLKKLQSDNLVLASTEAYKCTDDVVPIKGIALHFKGDSPSQVIDLAQKVNENKCGNIKYVAVCGNFLPTLSFDAACQAEAYETACRLMEIMQKSPVNNRHNCFVFDKGRPKGMSHICGLFIPEDLSKTKDQSRSLRLEWQLWQDKMVENLRKLPGISYHHFLQTGLTVF